MARLGIVSLCLATPTATRIRVAPEKADRAGHMRVCDAESLHQQFGVTVSRARRKTGAVTIANDKGLRVLLGGAVLEAQGRAKRRVVPDQEPVVRRNQRDATPVDQTPRHDGRKCFLLSGGVQSREQVLTRESLVQVRQGTEEAFRVALRVFSQTAPVVRADFLRPEDFLERIDGPRSLRPLAT